MLFSADILASLIPGAPESESSKPDEHHNTYFTTPTNDIQPVALNEFAIAELGTTQVMSSPVVSPTQLIVIDSGISNVDQLIDDLKQNHATHAEILLLDGAQDGIEQITSALSTTDGEIVSLHIVSHGEEGQVRLGNTVLNSSNFHLYESQISSWQQGLIDDADILFYGCELAGSESGEKLVSAIGTVTSANVAASDDVTGHKDLGGDWELEYIVGAVETDGVFSQSIQTNYPGTFASVIDLSSGIELNTDGGNDAYLSVITAAPVFENASERTVELIFQMDSSSGANPHFISFWTSTELEEFEIALTPADEITVVVGGVTFTGAAHPELRDGNVHSIAVSWDNAAGAVTVYVDGEYSSSGNVGQGHTLGTNGALHVGQGQTPAGKIPDEAFAGTLYELRVWDEVRAAEEIALTHKNKFDPVNLPAGLVADFQFDDLNGNLIIDEVLVNNGLVVQHAGGAGFTISTPVEDLNIDENQANGTSVGFITVTDPFVPDDVVLDGRFTEEPIPTPPGFNTVSSQTAVESFGVWDVPLGKQAVFLDDPALFGRTPDGGRAVHLGNAGGPGAVQQTLNTVAGQTYQLTFAFTGDFDYGEATKDLRVTVGSSPTEFSITEPTGWTKLNPIWDFRTITFTANNATTTLSFESLDLTGNGHSVIGDVAVIEVPAAINHILNNNPSLTYDAASGKFYKYFATPQAFADAQNSAEGVFLNGVAGGLVTIGSASENQKVAAMIGAHGILDVHLGGTDTVVEGQWRWVHNGEQFSNATGGSVNGSFVGWNSGEPNDSGGEDYAGIYADETWNDTVGTALRSSIIEWDASEILSSLTYSLTDTSGAFAIDSQTGEITVVDGTQLNHETNNSHDVTVQVTNAAGSSYSKLMTIAVNDVNDSPIVSSGTGITLGTVAQNDTNPAGITIANFLASATSGDPITDEDVSAVEGIAISAATNTNGSWQYSVDNGNVWNGFPGSLTSYSLVLDGTSMIRFVPNPGYTGTESIAFFAWDQTDGSSSGDSVSTSIPNRGGGETFSTGALTATLEVIVNAKPIVDLNGAGAGLDTSLTHTENDAAVSIAPGAIVDDSGEGDIVSLNINAVGFNTSAAVTELLKFSGITLTGGSASLGTVVVGGTTFSYDYDGADILNFINNSGVGDVIPAADLQLLIRSIEYQNLSDSPTAGDIDFEFGAQDSAGQLSSISTATVTVEPVNDRPVNIFPTAVQNVVEDGTLTFSVANGNGIVVGDVDAGSAIIQTTLLATSGPLTLNGTTGLTFTVGNGIGNGTMTFQGTIADINAALNGLTYSPNADYNGSALLIVNTHDLGNTGSGGNLNDSDTININVTQANDAPLIDLHVVTAGNDYSTTYTEGDIPVSVVASGGYIEDTESNAYSSMSIGLSGFTDGSSERLIVGNVVFGYSTPASPVTAIVGATTFRFVFDGANLTITNDAGGTMPEADLIALLRDVKYEHTDNNPTGGNRLIEFIVADPQSIPSQPAVSTIVVSGVNDPPVIDLDADDSSGATGSSYNASFTAGGGYQSIVDVDAFILDVDSADLQSMTVRIVNMIDGTFEGLDTTIGGLGVSESYVAATGTYTVTGPAPVASFEQVLKSLTYNNASTTPDLTPRQIEIVVNDGIDDSVAITTFVDVIPDQIAPVVSNNTGITVNEDGMITLSSSELQYGDLQPATSLQYVVSTIPANGHLALITASTTPITVFTQDDIDSGRVAYYHHGSETTSDSFAFTVNDGLGNVTGTQSFAIVVNPTNDAPILYTGGNFQLTSIAEDTFNSAGDSIANIIASAGGDRITDADGDPEGIGIYQFDNSDGSWQYKAAVTDLNWTDIPPINTGDVLLLDATSLVRFVPDPNYFGNSGDIKFRAWDGTDSNLAGSVVTVAATGGSNPFSSTVESASLTISSVNDAPLIDLHVATAGYDYSTTYAEGDIPVSVTAPGAYVDDIESNNYSSLSISLTGFTDGIDEQLIVGNSTFGHGNATGPIAKLVGGTTFQIVFNGSDFTITNDAGGNMPLADLTTLLRDIRYQHSGGNPTAGDRFIEFSVADTQSAASPPAISTISVSAVNDAPTITNLNGDIINFDEGDPPTHLDVGSDVLIADIDSNDYDGGKLTVNIVSGGDTTEDIFGILPAGVIAIVGADVTFGGVVIGTVSNGTTMQVDFNANADAAAVEALIKTVVYGNTNTTDPATTSRVIEFVLEDGDGASSTVSSVTVQIGSVNDAPETYVSSAAGNEDNAGIAVEITSSDIDGSVNGFEITTLPLKGTLYTDSIPPTAVAAGNIYTATAGKLTFVYVPDNHFHGADSFQVVAVDNLGLKDSTPAVQSFVINPVNDLPIGLPGIAGTPTEDQTLTANTSGISDADGLGTFSYQWLRDGVAVPGSTTSSYTLGDADVGSNITLQVSYIDSDGTSEGPLTSTPVGPVANVNDLPSGLPVVLGSPTEDQTLTGNTSGISDIDGVGTFSYQWMRDGVAITGATGSSYTLDDADVGSNIALQVTYIDDEGTNEGPLTSGSVGPVANVNDLPVGVPTITGTPTEDQTLTANTSGISDDDGVGTLIYQWTRNGVSISGATNSSYTLGDVDVGNNIALQVSYVDDEGTSEGPLTSVPVGPVANVNDMPVGLPTITGTPTEDQILTANTSSIADDDGVGTFNYQWMRDGIAISGATNTSYTLGDMDVGGNIALQVSYVDNEGTNEGPLTSAPVGPVSNVNDIPVGLPTITGTPTEDQTLTANTSSIADDDGVGTFSYQWMRNGVAIGGATNNSYTLDDADVGNNIALQVSYIDVEGTSEGPLTSVPVGSVTNVNDIPVGLPTITGTPTEDQILTANTSSIADDDGVGTFSYQWMRDGIAISGATNASYTLGDADVGSNIALQVTYIDDEGTNEGPLTSGSVGPVANVNDLPVGVPAIIGSPTEDQTLTANTSSISDVDGVGAFGYQWMRNGVAISGATNSSYTLGDVDVGSNIALQVTYIDDAGTNEGPLTSVPVGSVTNVNDIPVGLPTITGTPTEDQILTANTSSITDDDGVGTFSYQWMRNGVAISGATNASYTLGDADVGSNIVLQVHYIDDEGTSEGPLTSVPIGPIVNVNDLPVGVPAIIGSPTEDQTLTANTSSISDVDGVGAFGYQWMRNGVAISGATNSSYTLGDADVGNNIALQVSYVDNEGTGEGPLTSVSVGPVTNVNDLPAGIPVITGTPTENQILTANTNGISDDDGVGVFSYQWTRDGVVIPGATNSSYTLGDTDVGGNISLQVSYIDDEGTSEGPLTSVAVGPIANVNDIPTGVPAIMGTPTEDQILTANTTGIADADGVGTFTYQWVRSGVAISGATNNSYTLGDTDVGSNIVLQVNYTDNQGNSEGPLNSSVVGPVANVNDLPVGVPTITGTPTEDQILTANTSSITDDDGVGPFSYQWMRDGIAISGATNTSYTLGDMDVGGNITLQVSYVDNEGTNEGPLTSAPVGSVANVNDLPVGLPTIAGTPTEDQTLTANTSSITDDDGVGTFSYQWMRNGVAIGGATNNSYSLGDADVGNNIALQVSYVDSLGNSEGPLNSVVVGPVANVNDVPNGIPVVTGIARENETLTIDVTNISDDDGLGTFTYQWTRNGVPIAGAIGSNYTLVNTDVDAYIAVEVRYQDGYGVDEGSLTSVPIGLIENVNNEPVGADKSVTLEEGTSLVISTGDFGFSDPLDNNSFQSIVIASLPPAGELSLDGSTVSVDQIISVADINSGKLVYTSPVGASGSGYDGFGFFVQDDGDTMYAGRDTDQTANHITFNTPVFAEPPSQAANQAAGEVFTSPVPIEFTNNVEPLSSESDVEVEKAALPQLNGTFNQPGLEPETNFSEGAQAVVANVLAEPTSPEANYVFEQIVVTQHNSFEFELKEIDQFDVGSAELNVLNEQPVKYASIGHKKFLDALRQVDSDLKQADESSNRKYQLARDSAVGVSISVTAGVLAWVLRGGALLSSLLTTTPLWKSFDPQFIYVGNKESDEHTDDEVEEYFSEED